MTIRKKQPHQATGLQARASKAASLLLFLAALPLAVTAGPASTTAPSETRPVWQIGDWWTVDSQRYDHGENRPGASPGWLDKETWKFSVKATNTVDGEACYEVSVKPEDHNRCPYWFVCSFRMSDLLVMRRELHQPTRGKTGPTASAAVVASSYAKEEGAPFMLDDFPNLPLTVPHFTGAATNSYHAKTFSRNGPSPTGSPSISSRLSAGSLTQTFRAGEKMPFDLPAGAKSYVSANDSGVVVLAPSPDKYERQGWNRNLPWHLWAERWQFGELVRKSWLSDYGHSDTNPSGPESRGVK